MLVLTRKVGEEILIGDGIRITMTSCKKDRASIGIDAPKEMRILRGELKNGQRTSDEQPRDQL